MMKILIAGDSFAADWTKKYEGIGWVNMLEKDYDITNIAEAGVSEYKIYKQLVKEKVTNFDKVIISHTSAYRIPVEAHPIHSKDILHHNCDFIYSDIKEHKNNPEIKCVIDLYEKYFHIDYALFVHDLIVKEINQICPNAINITFFNCFNKNAIQLENIFLENKGTMNHLNEKGNKIIYNKIKKLINEK
jgi:lysophospholipase L1-like esterase